LQGLLVPVAVCPTWISTCVAKLCVADVLTLLLGTLTT
jgi:hypothetical protein